MSITADMDYIKIWDEEFRGIGYQGLVTVNTKSYVDEPSRANDGSIPNIEDHDTFIVPRAQVNFKLFNIEDYQRLCRVINISNQFPVTYFDKQSGEFVTHYMYCESEELNKIFNIGTKLIGVLDYTISFIGTLNNLTEYTVTYYLNSTDDDSSTLSVATYSWGYSTQILTGDELVDLANELDLEVPSDKTFASKWNTRRDGSGISYFPGTNATVLENLTLYAQWE